MREKENKERISWEPKEGSPSVWTEGVMGVGSGCYTRLVRTENSLVDLVRWSLLVTLLRADSVESWEERMEGKLTGTAVNGDEKSIAEKGSRSSGGWMLRYVCIVSRMIPQEGTIDNAGKWMFAG